MDTILFQSFINIEKWDIAKWRATAFLHDPEGVRLPYLGIVFENIEAGKEIFSEWLERLGKVDEFDELRISIVERHSGTRTGILRAHLLRPAVH